MNAEIVNLGGRVVVVGAGVAGLMTALELAPRPVVVLSKGPLGAEGSTLWAQGGLAAAFGAGDSPALHAADTLKAGDGVCDPAIVDQFTRAAPAAILRARAARRALRPHGGRRLRARARSRAWASAHRARRRRRRGARIDARARRRRAGDAVDRDPGGLRGAALIVDENAVRGVLAVGPAGPALFAAEQVVIATGGIGGLFEESTNPLGSFGQGVALAARAGAALADMEFVQFHPTALDVAAAADAARQRSGARRGRDADRRDGRAVHGWHAGRGARAA